jgi:hypothetical protein
MFTPTLFVFKHQDMAAAQSSKLLDYSASSALTQVNYIAPDSPNSIGNILVK